MASDKANGMRLYQAQKKALGIVLNRATPERKTKIRTALVSEEALPSVNRPLEMAAFHMDLIAGLSEIVEAQHVRIARLENPSAPVAAAHSPEISDVMGADLAEVLRGAGYEDTSAVAAATDEALLDVKGIGPAKLQEIREATANLGAEPGEA